MLSFLTRVIFVSRYDVQETGALTGEWRVMQGSGNFSLWEIITGSKQSRTTAALELKSLSGHQQHYSKSANITPDSSFMQGINLIFPIFISSYIYYYYFLYYLPHASLVPFTPIFNHHSFLIHTRSSLSHFPTEDGIKGIRTLKI